MREFVGKYGASGFPHIADVDGDTWEAFGITYQPRWGVIRRDGTVETGGGFFPSEVVDQALAG